VSATSISFARGAPSLDIVDIAGLREAADLAFREDPAGLTAYGTATGYGPLRAWIAEQHGVPAEQVIVTNGSMQADAFLFDALVRPGDPVIVENPTYDRTLASLRGRGADVRPVELEPDGIDVAALERVLKTGAQPRLAHIIPNFQNPAGYTLSRAKREALVELAREYDFVLFEDDPYREVRFRGEPLPTMLSMDPRHVVYASSFSKIVAPGVRVGYLIGPPELIAQVTQLAVGAYISPSMLSQGIVNQFVRGEAFPGAITTVRTALAQRAAAVGAALERELPDARFQVPEGGYFMWVDLPRGTDVEALFTAAKDRGVQFVKGADFMLEGGESSLRLAYSGVTPAEIEEGIARLGDAYRQVTAATADVV
jgi:DNA-binding transcriptional MocR family regulator